MSKLIVLNGPLGSGKSTLARAYADKHSLTLTLDIDEIWFMISHWRENWAQSSPLAKDMAFSMAKVYLGAGHDIIVPLATDLIQMPRPKTKKSAGSNDTSI